MKTIIIIPVRMASSRFPNKPMALIGGKPMVQHVWEKAIASKLGEVLVACAEKEVSDLIDSLGGKAIMTNPSIPSGTDRVFAALKDYAGVDELDSIINLQGDMPLISSEDIVKVNIPLTQGFDVGTLVTSINDEENKNINITKAKVTWIKNNFIGEATDFYKTPKLDIKNVYHHVGIYSFRYAALKKFVHLPTSQNELYHKLEQWRALDAKMTIGVNYVNEVPISVDTKEDLIHAENIIRNN